MNETSQELVDRLTRHARAEGVNASAISGVSIFRNNHPSAPLPTVYHPCVCIVVQGRKRSIVGDDVLLYDPLNYLVVSVTVPAVGQIIEASPERPYLCLRIDVDLATVSELLSRVQPRVTSSDAQRGLYVARTDSSLLDAVVRLSRLLDTPSDVAVLSPLILREIHYRVLTGELGHRLRDVCVKESHAQRIARVIERLRTRFAEPLRVEDLADVAHMSASTLHHRFKLVTGVSPMQYQKQLRLHEARRLMLVEGLEASSAAHRVGYESASQFSREYRRLFGAPPRMQVDALREQMSV